MSASARSLIAKKIAECLPKNTRLETSALPHLLKIDANLCTPKQTNNEANLAFSLPLSGLVDGDGVPDRCGMVSLASDIVHNIQTDSSLLSAHVDESHRKDVSVKFRVSSHDIIKEVLRNSVGDCLGHLRKNSLLSSIPRQKVVVEFSSPNIAKPFHVGHIRSTILGHWLSRLHESLGHGVTRLNYLGDWGTQFGLLKYGCDRKGLSKEDLTEDPIRKLYEVYVWVNREADKDENVKSEAKKIFAGMEEGKEDHLQDWKFFKDISIKDLKRTYSRLGIYFDEFHGESSYTAEKCSEILEAMESRGLITSHPDGRKMYCYGKGKKVTLLKSDGAGIYLTRDMAAAVDRYEKYNFDKHYYVVDTTQIEHFRALFSSLKDMNYNWAHKMSHVRFGRINGMSSRKGTTLSLNDVLDEGRKQMKLHQTLRTTTKVEGEEADTAANIIALSALFVYDLKRQKVKDYNFQWRDALYHKGNTGVKLQYTHCRLINLEHNYEELVEIDADITSLLSDPLAYRLATVIATFDEVLFDSYSKIEPSVIASYLFSLCDAINIAHKNLKVKDCPDKSLAKARLLLFVAARKVLGTGIHLMGVQPLDRM